MKTHELKSHQSDQDLEKLLREYVADFLANNTAGRMLDEMLRKAGIGIRPIMDHLTFRTHNIDRRAEEFLERFVLLLIRSTEEELLFGAIKRAVRGRSLGPAVEANTCAGFLDCGPQSVHSRDHRSGVGFRATMKSPGKSWYLQTNCRIVLSVSATEWDAKHRRILLHAFSLPFPLGLSRR
jgi:hypothetical protein